MKELIKMCIDRLLHKLIRSNKYKSENRYFEIIQSDGLCYQTVINKSDIEKNILYWIQHNIQYREISDKEYYKDVRQLKLK